VLFFSKGSYFYDGPNLLLLDIEPVLFTNLDICGQFWGKIGELGRDRPEKRILHDILAGVWDASFSVPIDMSFDSCWSCSDLNG
jgi:hypothetical protein